ncbi:MAG TPA: hypothetical protein VNZ49_01415 [Bacteroidia bacterium]|jgi:hypothetical protein|nr:hypothetical protein [Bacteroidia bacterium]
MIKRKVKGWLKRYLPPEIVGTITAVSAAGLIHIFTENLIFIAYAGSFGEAIGFYSTIFIQNILIVSKKNKVEKKIFSFADITGIIATIVLEFGPAGLIDGLLLRPFFMFIFPILLKNFTLGVLIGKFTGDLTFYILVILSYEIRKWKT